MNTSTVLLIIGIPILAVGTIGVFGDLLVYKTGITNPDTLLFLIIEIAGAVMVYTGRTMRKQVKAPTAKPKDQFEKDWQ